jgi:ABC-type uncharacterized transport system ATPase subunit
VDPSEFKKYGEILSYRDHLVSLSIERKRSAHITAEILEKFPVEDLTIHEKDMEEIVGEIFRTRQIKAEKNV